MTSPTRASVRRRPPAQGRHADRTCGHDGAAAQHVGASPHRVDQLHVEPSTGRSAHALLDAALTEPASGLPHAPLLERRFGQRLGWVQARNGPLTRQALDALGALAATRGDTVFLRGPQPPYAVVAHEVTHALQARLGSGVDHRAAGPDGIVPAHTRQEREAVALASPWWAPAPAPVRPATTLPDRAIALLRPGAATNGGGPTLLVEPAEPARADSAHAAMAPTPARGEAAATTGPAMTAEQRRGRARPAGAEGQQPPAAAEAGAELALPPSPELTLSADQLAQREAGLAEAEAALAGAGDASAVLHAFADAPPTLKAREAGALSSRLAPVVATDTQQWQSAVPVLEVDLRGETGAPPEALRVQAPPAGDVDLEPEPVAAAPQPEVAQVPEPPPFTSNDGLTSVFAQVSQAPPEQLAQTIGDSLSDVQTTDPSVPRSPGPPPDVPLAGETDPTRIATQEHSAAEQATGAREAATRAVVDGPGPEQARPVQLHETHPIEAVEPPAPASLIPPEGPRDYLALDLPPEVQTTFDAQQQAAMRDSLTQATAQADEATAERDTARDEAVTTAEAGAAELNRTANADQQTAVGEARTTIQDERQGAIDAQHGEVERVRGEAADRRETDENRIDTQVATEQKAIDDRYVQGENDIADEIAEGERKARAQREQAERDAADESWWDRAVSFVKDAFDALVDAIGSIFDAVRDAVNTVLDAVKDFAISVIDRVASFVKDAIAAFGEFLKSAVDALIGSVFPELAEALNAAIDSAVAVAQAAVDVVADALKAGVSALVETLRAGLNAALDAFEAGISLAVTFVGAALTGDWAMLARKVLESVLRLIGVAPETFYAFIGRAVETFDLIVHDPLGFLSNLVSAVVGGVQAFADRFVVHLRGGVIGWLTGTLGGAGIVLPPAFDLAGVLDLARQILGLTWDMIRSRAARLLGAQNVERLEYLGEYVASLVNAGWPGLWDKLKADLSGLVDTVFDAIKSFLLDRVVLGMVKKIPLLFTPAGAIVQLVLTAWNLYEFLRDQLSRIMQVVQTVLDSVGDIARGVLVGAVGKVQELLGQLLPIALDLLARLLGLGNLAEDVRKVIDRVRGTIDRAIDALLRRVVGLFTGAGRRGTAVNDPAAGTVAAGAEVGPGAGPLLETFIMAGEEHTVRAVGPEGEATLELASGSFDGLNKRLNSLVRRLKRDYTARDGAKYVGDAQAPELDRQLGDLLVTAQTLINDVAKEKSKRKERRLVQDGFTALRQQVTALALQEATSEVLHPGHGPKAGPVRSHGRQTWFEVNPLSVNSPGRGGNAQDPVPGVKVLPGYDRGHLVARSLGGPGSPDNLVPMSAKTNTERVGVVGVEDSLRYALGKFLSDYPRASPPYVFSYRVTARYHQDSALQQDLERRGVARPDSGAKLFALAEAATSAPPSGSDMRAAVTLPEGATPREDENLPENLRRRLMYYFAPHSISAAVEVLQEPESYAAPIYQSSSAPNHLGRELEWQLS